MKHIHSCFDLKKGEIKMQHADKTMVEYYNEQKANEVYNITFFYNNVVYLYETEHLKEQWLYEKERHNNYFIQLILKKDDKIDILTNEPNNVEVLCTIDEFNKKKQAYSKKYNKTFNNGTITEVLVKHIYNQRYTGHATTPYYVAGDICVKDDEIQIKFKNAQVASYSTIKKVAGLI